MRNSGNFTTYWRDRHSLLASKALVSGFNALVNVLRADETQQWE
jgi:hypothetical protein